MQWTVSTRVDGRKGLIDELRCKVVDVTTTTQDAPAETSLGRLEAETFASWFATLSDPTRVRLLHAVSTAPAGHIRIGDLALELGIGQPTVTHHVQKLKIGRAHV